MPRPTDFLIHICFVFVAIVTAWSLIGTLLSMTLGHALLVGLAAWAAYRVGKRQGLKEVRERPRPRVKGRKLAVVK